jgi:hypothetical protein
MDWRSTLFYSVLFGVSSAWATPPTIYSQPAYESPVRGDPDDLLILGGSGFAATDTVVYQSISDTTSPPAAPTSVPSTSTATSGVAPVVSQLNVPDSLTVALPNVMLTDQSYVLWVRNQAGEWSNGVEINDARPMWITPDTAYVTASLANLPRSLKVVGRNLQPAPGAATQVKLIGPGTFTLTAANDSNPATAIERYAAKISLPATLPAGAYTAQVSRDGVSWVTVGQTLQVVADPAAPSSFAVSSYGCQANDGVDDTSCIVQAIAAAAVSGGTVMFGPGTWNMNASNGTGVTSWGVMVPVGVNLAGAGASSTTIERDTTWPVARPIFTLQGKNIVHDITFKDAYTYSASFSGGKLIGLGVDPAHAHVFSPTDPTTVSQVTITNNVFDKPFEAIQDDGMLIDHLYVTYNEFGAYQNAIYIDQDSNLADSIFSFNTFEPSSDILVTQAQGVVATQISAGHRVDFSNNVADGTSTRFLYNPADPPGWRAAFFWNMKGSQENLLISQNNVSCSGDKAGDGEAFSFDSSGSIGALPAAQSVISATAGSVTVAGPLTNASTVPNGYYNDFWVTVVQGPGKGQSRRITVYAAAPSTPVTFDITPGWDVIPTTGSTVVVSREYYQVYTVDNFVDQRTTSQCTKGNANKPAGGLIGIYGQTTDSAIEGNQQFDTSGISVGTNYLVVDHNSTVPYMRFSDFVDIRGNTISGEYDYGSDCSFSGVQLNYGGTDTVVPPPEMYGVAISHNTITQADGYGDGAIAFARGWYGGPSPTTWDLVDNTLVFHNSISNIAPPLPTHVSQWPSCGAGQSNRLGENISEAEIWHTVLYANSCQNVANASGRSALNDRGAGTQRVCPANAGSDSCECAPFVQGNATAASSPLSTLQVTYSSAQLAGNLNVVVIGWADATTAAPSVTDTSGNTYTRTILTTAAGNATQAIYWAKNTVSAPSNTVTVTFSTAVPNPSLRVAEYAGIDFIGGSNPVDVQVGASGAGLNASSGSVSNNSPNVLLFGATYDGTPTSSPVAGPGYTARLSTTPYGNLVEDRTVSAFGAYNATTTTSGAGFYITQLIAFRMSSYTGDMPGAEALTVPAGLSVTAASGTQMNLSWTASTDNVGVTGYSIERCTGSSCTNFISVATVTGTSYSDNGLTGTTTYRYRVRAIDVAKLQSAYSTMVTGTTL